MSTKTHLPLLIIPFVLASCGGGGGSGGTNAPGNPVVGKTVKVGGTVTGLRGTGLMLQMGQGETLPIQATGTFTFPTALASGGGYDVKIVTQPKSPAQLCKVNDGAGTLPTIDVTNVSVVCENAPMGVGGTVSGLRGRGFSIRLKAAASGQPVQDFADLPLSANGSFTFPPLTDGMAYEASIVTQPSTPSQSCVLANGAGTLDGHDVTTLAITCTTATFTVGGTVTALHGQGLVLRNNGGDDLSIASDGSFTFNTRVEDGATFDIKVVTQPTLWLQTCFVANGSGTVVGADLNSVQVTCTATQQLGTSGDDEAHGAALDSLRNLYVAGQTTGSFGGPSAGGSDGFLIKLNRNGDMQWKRQFGSAGDEIIHDLEIDSHGDLYLCGSTTGSLDGNANAGSDDIFVTKYDGNGNKLWTRLLGSAASDVALGLRISTTGAIFLTGHTTGSVDGITTPGDTDLFTAKLDSSGSPLWVRQLGTPAFDAAYGIDVGTGDHAFVAGSTTGNLDGHANVSGGETGFILEYDDLGNLQDSALFCQLGCLNPSTAVHYQSHFNSIALVIGGGAKLTGWTRNDESGSVSQQYALLTTYESGSFTGRGAYGAVGDMVSTQFVPGRADSMLYMTGHADSQTASGKKYAFVKQINLTTFGQRYEAVTEGPGDEVGLAVVSDLFSNAWMVGYATAGVDGNEGLGGRDIFIAQFNINGEKQ